ncbi:MAG: hypothetical protein IJ215_02765 [Clostridia bacterium]|nr:hypothetical protein [Clostridia bacterium]
MLHKTCLVEGGSRNNGSNNNNSGNSNSNNHNNNNSNVLGLSQNTCNNTDIEGLSSDNWCCLLNNFIGRRCECEFDVGDELVSRTGILEDVGTDFLVLSSLNNNSSILLCDTCALRFVRVE